MPWEETYNDLTSEMTGLRMTDIAALDWLDYMQYNGQCELSLRPGCCIASE